MFPNENCLGFSPFPPFPESSEIAWQIIFINVKDRESCMNSNAILCRIFAGNFKDINNEATRVFLISMSVGYLFGFTVVSYLSTC